MKRKAASQGEKSPENTASSTSAQGAKQKVETQLASEQKIEAQSQTRPVVEKKLGAGIDDAEYTQAEQKSSIGATKIDQSEKGHVDSEVVKEEGSPSSENHKSNDQGPNELFIDLERLEEKGFVALSEKRTLINEEYRSIKRKLLSNAFGPISKTLKNSNLILVSSSKPNEGKTFTSVNLALSIALEQDKTVLLVDSDVLKPSVSKTLDIGNNVGLIEYLLGEEEDVSKIIYRTNVENLRVLPAGLPHHLSNELLSSQKMMTLIEEFATRYPDRVVVFDAPPLLGVNETSVMAEQCGQGVVVVEEHKSKLSDVQSAVELLPEDMAVGFVLNKSISQDPEHGYGYGYGYYYGASRPDKAK
jgi:receptor protein-tyrosine kinase